MQRGQAFGPFTLEKELGNGAMGVVWRAVYTKTGQRLAIKIMAPGFGDQNPVAVARFEREAAILKQFNHPNIVKLFGIGKFQGVRYYAMEYIDGESLDRLMSRRDRMTWEEVVALGQQLCAALQHAHERGVIHRDLKPSNLMILKDGVTLKLTDFGIAKDLDETGLTETNRTVGTASYMSPEQCRGKRELTPQSDLYSLGIVFYELVTGQKPFKADNPLEMFMAHVNVKPVRPAKRILDLPVWFDNLICHLLEKEPEKRPKDAATVAEVLGTIQEKVEAQQSAGLEAATRKRGDRPPRAVERTEEDRAAARALAGKGNKRRRAKTRFYERGWFVALGALLLVGALAFVLYLFVGPPSMDTLYARAKVLMESKNPDTDWPRAIDVGNGGPLYLFEVHYPGAKGEQAEQMRRWALEARKRECDKLVSRYVQNKKEKKPFPVQAQGDTQENAFDAGWAEEEGDVARAEQRWAKVKELAETSAWVALADEHLSLIKGLGDEEKELVKQLDRIRDFGDTVLQGKELSEEQKELALALRYERFDDKFRAYQDFEQLREKYSKQPEQRRWYLFAAKKAKELKPKPGVVDLDQTRKDRLAARLEEARQLLEANKLYDARLIYLHIVALYGNDKDYKESVAAAKEGLAKVAAKLGGGG